MRASKPSSYQKNVRGREGRDGKRNAGGRSAAGGRAAGRTGRTSGADGAGRIDRSKSAEFATKKRGPAAAVAVLEAPETEQLEGRHPVLEALKMGRTINKILLAEGAAGGSANEILGKARDQGVIVQRVPRSKIDAVATTANHQGIIAYLAAKEYVELDDIIERAAATARPGLVVLLDEVEDPFNLGSILRSANGAGAHGVVIPKRRAVPLTATVAKSSAGAIEHVPVARVTNISQAIETLKRAGYWIVGTDIDAKGLYYQTDLTSPIAIVIGSEGKGLSESIKRRCDLLVRLPMIGEIQSLNAGVAAGILLYEAVRQRSEKRV